jgi:hypothetical protein
MTATIAETATLTHGYTMRDVENAARTAVRKCPIWVDLHSREEREEAAWLGIVEFLYECGCAKGHCTRQREVGFLELVHAGFTAIYALVREGHRDLGMRGDGEQMPNFQKYWLPVRRQKGQGSDGFSDQICDRLVLREALAVLTPMQYEAVAALAAFNNGVLAAKALGITHGAFCKRLDKARRKVKQVWVEDEWSASARIEGTCKRGHPRAVYSNMVRSHAKSGTSWNCEECGRIRERERGRVRRAGERLELEANALAEPNAALTA